MVHPRNRWPTSILLLVWLLVVSMATACTDDAAEPKNSKPDVVATGAGSLTAKGFTVTGLKDAGRFRVTTGGNDQAEQSWMRPISPVFAVAPSGALSEAVTVTIDLTTRPDPDSLVLIGTRETETQPWSYQPATVAADGRSASVTVDHFSFFTSVLVTLKELWQIFQTQFQEGLSAGLAQHIVKPKCESPKDFLDDGYAQKAVTKSDAVYWCTGMEDGTRVAKLVNNRRYPMVVAYGKKSFTLLREKPASAHWTELAALSRALSGETSIVASGDEIVYTVDTPVNTGSRIKTEADHFGQSFSALQTGVTTAVDIITLFKPDPKSIPAAVRAKDYASVAQQALKIHECTAPLGSTKDVKAGDYLAGCMTETTMTQLFGATWAPAMSKLFAFMKVVGWLQGEVNLLYDTIFEHDKFELTVAHASTGMTRKDLLTAPVPSLRGNPAGVLKNGKLAHPSGGGSVYLETTGGGAPALGDLTGDDQPDAAAIIAATAGAGGLDQYLLVYSKAAGNTKLIGSYDLTAAGPDAGSHATVTGMTIDEKLITVSWTNWTAASGSHRWQATLSWNGTKLVTKEIGEAIDEASRIGNEFVNALTSGDRQTQERLANPEALAVLRTWETGNPGERWFSSSKCITDGVPPRCSIVASYGPAPDTGLIFDLTFSDPKTSPVRITAVTFQGDAG